MAVAAGAFVQLQHCMLPFLTDNFCSNGRKSALAFKSLLLHLTKSRGTYEQVCTTYEMHLLSQMKPIKMMMKSEKYWYTGVAFNEVNGTLVLLILIAW